LGCIKGKGQMWLPWLIIQSPDYEESNEPGNLTRMIRREREIVTYHRETPLKLVFRNPWPAEQATQPLQTNATYLSRFREYECLARCLRLEADGQL
jgi:hypothetical protein